MSKIIVLTIQKYQLSVPYNIAIRKMPQNLILTATGAWFTGEASKDDLDDKAFGVITIAVDEATAVEVSKDEDVTYLETTDMMPGDTVTVSYTINNTKDAAYVKVVVKATVTMASGTDTLGLAAELSGTKYYKVNAGSSCAGSYSAQLKGADYTDAYEKATISFEIHAYAIQQANVTMNEVTGELSTDANNGAVAWPAEA